MPWVLFLQILKSVTKRNADVASGFYNKAVGVNVMAAALTGFAGSAASQNLFERNGLRCRIVNCNHFATYAIKKSIYYKGAKLCAKASIVLAGFATALCMTDIGCANLFAGKQNLKLRGKLITNATKTYV